MKGQIACTRIIAEMGEIFERPFPPRALEWTGERLTGGTSGQTEIEHLHRYFFARSLCRDLDVLDIASGEGYGSAMISQVARSVTGVEIDEASVRHARQAYIRPGLSYLQGDARKIPLPDASVDAVVSFETLEHFFEHDTFMSEIRRVLRPSGFLVISSPERDVYSPAGSTPNPYHVNELTHDEFDNLMRRHFGHVGIYGQRPLLGAALIPEFVPTADSTPFLTFERRDLQRFEASTGLPRSIYLVAIASDSPIILSRGCLFVETSGVEAIFAREAQSLEEHKRLTSRLIEEGEYAQRVQVELNRRDEQLAAKVNEAQDWHRQLVVRNEEYAALEVALNQLNAQIDQQNEPLAKGVLRENAFRLESSQQRSAHAGTQARLEQLRKMQGALSNQSNELAVLRERVEVLTRSLAQAVQEKANTENRLEAIYLSSSWRLTRPMRDLFVRYPRIGRLAMRTARFCWRALRLRFRQSPRAALASSPSVNLAHTVESLDGKLPLTFAETLPLSEAGQSPIVFSPRRLSDPTALHPDALLRGHGRRLLFVSHVIPFPPRAGNEYRIHRLLDWLSKENWAVTLVICPLPGDPLSEEQITQMAAVYPALIVCQHDGTLSYNLAEDDDVIERLGGLAPRAFSPLLEEVNASHDRTRIIQLQRTFCPDVLAELLVQLDQALRPDVLLAEYIFMTRPFALLRPDLLKVVDTIDVFSTKARKVEHYGVSDGLALTEEEEALLLRRADILIGIQPEEAADLARLSSESEVLSVGVDFRVIGQPWPLPLEPVALLVASRNPMNTKGVNDFLKYAWPLVREAIPQATLRVVGSIGDIIQDVPEGVEIVGQVDQLGPQYAEARVAINPAIAGTGLKIKTVEALCNLRPVVTWPAGVDGIVTEARPFCHVATHWFGFAQAMIVLLRDNDKASAIGNARESLAHAFSPEYVYAPLRRALNKVD